MVTNLPTEQVQSVVTGPAPGSVRPPDTAHTMEKKLSTVEDDFESLFEEEEVNTDRKTLSFNDLFEAISEECQDPVEHILILGDTQAGNVEDDFEALLSDESDAEVLTSEISTQETLNGEVKGFSQIFSSDSSQQVRADPGHGEPGQGHYEAGNGHSQV